MERNGDGGRLDLDKIIDTLEPEDTTTGFDVLARRKREELSMDSALKVPKDWVASIAVSLNEEEELLESNVSNDVRKYSIRRYRELATSETSNSGRSDWDDGWWEWEDTPRCNGHSSGSRHHRSSPSPMLVGASPDARLVSQWLGGRTPNSSAAASPWDIIDPSPTPVRASGSSFRSASSRYGEKSNPVASSANKLKSAEDGEDGIDDASKDQNHEISESLRLEIDILT